MLQSKNKSLFAYSTTVKFKCLLYFYEEPHAIYKCCQFLALMVQARREIITKLKLYDNCIWKHKENNKCNAWECRKWREHHNTLLHEDTLEKDVKLLPSTSISAHAANTPGTKVVLSTAIIKNFNKSNEPVLARAFSTQRPKGIALQTI